MKKGLLIALMLIFATPFVVNAQLKKSSEIEKVRSFTNGTVALFKTTIIDDFELLNETIEIYAVKLPNVSTYHSPIVLYLGTKENMLKNLQDFSDALNNGKKGESFEFDVLNKKYYLSFGKVLGQRCFLVSEPYSSSNDYGRFFKSTIDDIIEYFKKVEE